MSGNYCSNCGEKLAPDANFCPKCGAVMKKLVETKAKRSGLVTAGGILTIVGACFSVVSGVFGLIVSIATIANPYSYGYYRGAYDALLVVGLFGLIGFAFGLAGGIQALRRKQFAFSIVGISLLMLAGFLNFLALGMPYGSGVFWALVFGLPIVVFALLGLVFVAAKKTEFT